jgi:hypothetical protein
VGQNRNERIKVDKIFENKDRRNKGRGLNKRKR